MSGGSTTYCGWAAIGPRAPGSGRTRAATALAIVALLLVSIHRSLLEAGLPATVAPEELWRRYVAPGLDDHMGPVFEELARAAVASGEVPLPMQPFRVGAWWDARHEREVDVVALSLDGDVLAAECKWGTADHRDVRRLQERAAHLLREVDRPGRLHLALFAGRGLADERAREAADRAGVQVFGASDLAPGPRSQ